MVMLSKTSNNLLKAVKKEVLRRVKNNDSIQHQADFADFLKYNALLLPNASRSEYQHAVKEICDAGLAKYYTRGGFLLSSKGLLFIKNPLKYYSSVYRSEIIGLLSGIVVTVAGGVILKLLVG